MNTKGKIAVLVVIAVLLAVGFWFLREKSPDFPDPILPTSSIYITEEEINEENFTGSRPIISGGGELGDRARDHIEKTIAEFKIQADNDVPKMREEFGLDSPTANYILDIKAEYILGTNTESIVISEYYYTGGANGTGLYTIFTASLESGEILFLTDIIREERKEDFVSLLRSKLMAWRPSGTEEPVVFIEDVGSLTFSNITKWSMDNENLTIYFDEYEVGPGSLGAFAFPIPLSELSSFLVSDLAPVASESSVQGCYVARLGENGQDVYTLRVEKEKSGYASGFLSYNNYEKDSSSGPFVGTYKDGILRGDYSFHSEGMFSISEVVFKNMGDSFVQGFGDVEFVGNNAKFKDLNNLTFNSDSIFIKEDCNQLNN